MKTVKKLYGERIQAFRERAGYKTQTALAEAIGTDRARVSDWERGKNEPKGELRITLLRLIKASEDQIFGMDRLTPPAPANQNLAERPPSAQQIAEAVKKIIEPSLNLSAQEQELLRIFRLAKPERRDHILNTIRRLIVADKSKARSNRSGA